MHQIQFLLGYGSVRTTERYLGCKAELGNPVNNSFAATRILVNSQRDPAIEVVTR